MISAPYSINGIWARRSVLSSMPRSARTEADQIVEHDRRKEYKARAEKASQHAAEPADDHHGENLDRMVEVELLRRHVAQIADHQHRADDAADKRARPEREQLELEGIDADDLGRIVLLADSGKRAAESRCDSH